MGQGWRAVLLAAVAVAVGACSGADPAVPPTGERTATGSPTGEPPPGGGADGGSAPSADTSAVAGAPGVSATLQPPARFDAAAAYDTVAYIADEVGPREATSDAFDEAASWVRDRFADLGYQVDVVEVPVPEGDPDYRPEWGTVVEPGTSANVVASPEGFDPAEPHVVIGGHLDSVAVSPGAEDNASGIAAVLELARLIRAEPPALPVRLVAFGAEEPRGPGDNMHHFGSRQYVRNLPDDHGVVAMVSLDRVGVAAARVPVCTGGTGPTEVRDELLAAAEQAGVDAERCENRASDHWSFEKADIPAARLGSVPFAGYHSQRDVPAAVDVDQLDRVGTIVWTWLRDLER